MITTEKAGDCTCASCTTCLGDDCECGFLCITIVVVVLLMLAGINECVNPKVAHRTPGLRNMEPVRRNGRTSFRQKRTCAQVRSQNKQWVLEGEATTYGTEAKRAGGRGMDQSLLTADAPTDTGAVVSTFSIPSGVWRGWYRQYGSQHNLFEFQLSFHEDASGTKTVRGFGTDDVGTYSINDGAYSHVNGRVCFTKKYVLGTGDRAENLGHNVEYRGTFQGSVAAGLRGSWFVSTSRYTGEG